MRDLLNDTRLTTAQEFFALSCRFSREWNAMLAEALATYGDHGPGVSGCGRDHFPDAVKDALRAKARQISFNSALAHDARPKNYRIATMRALARAVATRDGSGFYGPRSDAA